MNSDLNYNRQAKVPAANNESAPAGKTGVPLKVDGFGQVLELLQVADSSFRESLLKRLALKDPALARSLRQKLAQS